MRCLKTLESQPAETGQSTLHGAFGEFVQVMF